MDFQLDDFRRLANRVETGNAKNSASAKSGTTQYVGIGKKGGLILTNLKPAEKLTGHSAQVLKKLTENVNLRFNLLEKIRAALVPQGQKNGTKEVETFLTQVRAMLFGDGSENAKLKLKEVGQNLKAETLVEVFSKFEEFKKKHKDVLVSNKDLPFEDPAKGKANASKEVINKADEITTAMEGTKVTFPNGLPKSVDGFPLMAEALKNLTSEEVCAFLGLDKGSQLTLSVFKPIRLGSRRFVQFTATTSDGVETAVLIGVNGKMAERASYNSLLRELQDHPDLKKEEGKLIGGIQVADLDSAAYFFGLIRAGVGRANRELNKLNEIKGDFSKVNNLELGSKEIKDIFTKLKDGLPKVRKTAGTAEKYKELWKVLELDGKPQNLDFDTEKGMQAIAVEFFWAVMSKVNPERKHPSDKNSILELIKKVDTVGLKRKPVKGGGNPVGGGGMSFPNNMSDRQRQILNGLGVDMFRTKFPDIPNDVKDADLKIMGASLVANGKYLLCEVSYSKSDAAASHNYSLLVDRTGKMFKFQELDYGKLLDFLQLDNAWMADLFEEEDWPMLVNLFGRLSKVLDDAPRGSAFKSMRGPLKQVLVPMLSGAIRKIRARGGLNSGEISVNDLMRELRLDKYAEEKPLSKYVTGTDAEKLVRALLVQIVTDSFDGLMKKANSSSTVEEQQLAQFVTMLKRPLKTGEPEEEVSPSLLLHYLTLQGGENVMKKSCAQGLIGEHLRSFAPALPYDFNLLHANYPVFPGKESYSGGCVIRLSQLRTMPTQKDLQSAFISNYDRQVGVTFSYVDTDGRNEDVMAFKNTSIDQGSVKKTEADQAITKLRDKGFSDRQIFTAALIPNNHYIYFLTMLGVPRDKNGVSLTGLKATVRRDKDGNMVAHYRMDNLQSTKHKAPLTLEYEVRIDPDGKQTCTQLDAYRVLDGNKILPIVKPNLAQSEALVGSDVPFDEIVLAKDCESILCRQGGKYVKIDIQGKISSLGEKEYKALVLTDGIPLPPKDGSPASKGSMSETSPSELRVGKGGGNDINVPQVEDLKHWKNTARPVDLLGENLLLQSVGSNCCWFFSVINGLKFTKEGREHLKGLVHENTDSVSFHSGSGDLVQTRYSGNIKFRNMPDDSSLLERYAMAHAYNNKMIPDRTQEHGPKVPWAPGMNGDMEASCKMLGLVAVPTSTNITDMGKTPSYDDYAQEIARHLNKGEIATFNKGSYHFVTIAAIKKVGDVYYVRTVDSFTGEDKYVSLPKLLKDAWGEGDSAGKRAALYFMQRPIAYKPTAENVRGMLDGLTTKGLVDEIKARKSWHDASYAAREGMGDSQQSNREDDRLRSDLIGKLLEKFDFNVAKARFARFLSKEEGWREVPGWEARGFDLTKPEGVQKLFADWLIAEHFRVNNSKPKKKDAGKGNVAANGGVKQIDGGKNADKEIPKVAPAGKNSGPAQKIGNGVVNQKQYEESLDKVEEILPKVGVGSYFNIKSMLRSYDPAVVEQLNFLLPLIAPWIEHKDYSIVLCFVCMMPEAVEKVKADGGFGQDPQENFAAIWKALNLEGKVPQIPKPGDGSGMEKLAKSFLDALADRIAKDIADAMGGEDAVEELSGDFKKYLTLPSDVELMETVGKLNKKMKDVGGASFCAQVLGNTYRSGLGNFVGLRYSDILVGLKDPSYVPAEANFYWLPEDGPLQENEKEDKYLFPSYKTGRYFNLGFWLDGKKLDQCQPEESLKALKDENYNFSPRQIVRAVLYLDQLLNVSLMQALPMTGKNIKVSMGKATSGDMKVSFAFPACERYAITRSNKGKYTWRDNRDLHDTLIYDVIIHKDGSFVTKPIRVIKAPKLTEAQDETYKTIVKGKGVKADSVRYNVAEDGEAIYCRYSDKKGFHEVAIDKDGQSMTVEDFKRNQKEYEKSLDKLEKILPDVNIPPVFNTKSMLRSFDPVVVEQLNFLLPPIVQKEDPKCKDFAKFLVCMMPEAVEKVKAGGGFGSNPQENFAAIWKALRFDGVPPQIPKPGDDSGMDKLTDALLEALADRVCKDIADAMGGDAAVNELSGDIKKFLTEDDSMKRIELANKLDEKMKSLSSKSFCHHVLPSVYLSALGNVMGMHYSDILAVLKDQSFSPAKAKFYWLPENGPLPEGETADKDIFSQYTSGRYSNLEFWLNGKKLDQRQPEKSLKTLGGEEFKFSPRQIVRAVTYLDQFLNASIMELMAQSGKNVKVTIEKTDSGDMKVSFAFPACERYSIIRSTRGEYIWRSTQDLHDTFIHDVIIHDDGSFVTQPIREVKAPKLSVAQGATYKKITVDKGVVADSVRYNVAEDGETIYCRYSDTNKGFHEVAIGKDGQSMKVEDFKIKLKQYKESLVKLEENVRNTAVYGLYDLKSMLRSYDPIVVEQLNFLLPMFASRSGSNDRIVVSCLVNMMPEAVDKVKKGVGFGKDKQKNFAAIWTALNLEGKVPQIPKPGDDSGMKELKKALLEALADRIAKDIADAMGGKEAVTELSGDIKKLLALPQGVALDKVRDDLDKRMSDFCGSFCTKVLYACYLDALVGFVGLHYSDILASLKNPSFSPAKAKPYWMPEDGPLPENKVASDRNVTQNKSKRFVNLGFWLNGKKLDLDQPKEFLKTLGGEEFSPRQIARLVEYPRQILNLAFFKTLAMSGKNIKVTIEKTTSGDMKVSFAFPACERYAVTRSNNGKYSWRDNRNLHDTFIHDVIIHDDGSFVTPPIREVKAPKLSEAQNETYEKIAADKDVVADSVRYNVAEDGKTIYCRYSDKKGFHEVAIGKDGQRMKVEDFRIKLKQHEESLVKLEEILPEVGVPLDFNAKSMLRSYDPDVVEQLNFLLPLFAQSEAVNGTILAKCLMNMMPEAVDTVKKGGGFGKKKQKDDFAAIWKALNLEGNAPKIPKPGDDSGMKKLAKSFVNALAGRIAKDIADAIGGEDAVKELSGDFKKYLTLTVQDRDEKEKVCNKLDEMMKDVGSRSCMKVLHKRYLSCLEVNVGMHYSDLLAGLKESSFSPTKANFYWMPEDGPLPENKVASDGDVTQYKDKRFFNLGFWLNGKKLDQGQPKEFLKALEGEHFSSRQIARLARYPQHILNLTFFLALAMSGQNIKVTIGKTASGDMKVSFAFPACERCTVTRLGKEKYSWRDNRNLHDAFIHDIIIHDDGSFVTQPFREVKAPKLSVAQDATYKKIIADKGVVADSVRYNVAEDGETIYCRYSDTDKGFHEVAIGKDGQSVKVEDFKIKFGGAGERKTK